MKKLTLNECQNFARNKAGKCLSNKYTNCVTKMLWKCENPEHLPWKASYNNIKSGSWCPECSSIKLSLAECQKFAESKGGKCLSTEYINNRTKMLWKCENPEHYVWEATFDGIKNGGWWCPECSVGKTQNELATIIKNILCTNVVQNFRGFDWLKDKNKQEIDIWVPDIKLAIEYDGKQHFSPVCFGGIPLDEAEKNFKLQKQRDRLKNKQIKKHLEEIRYFVRFNYKEKITKELVIKKLKKSGVI